MRTTISWLVALGLILSACSSTPETVETTTTSTSTTTTSTTTLAPTTSVEPTTTTTEIGETSLINGLELENPNFENRRVLAVKIDNHPKATPQSGIDLADAVIELRVEGITRFITIWHESDSDFLGPMRSGRPTDAHLLPAFNEPTFAISGAQSWVQSLIRTQDIHLIGEVHPATFRVGFKSAPHNLYVNTKLLRDAADGRGHNDVGPSGPIWEFGPMPTVAEPVRSVTMDFRGNPVTWKWHPTGVWLRNAYNEESSVRDEEGNEERIAMPVLVALYVDQYTASPPPGVSGKALPSSVVTGEGEAFVFADGKVVTGTWERETDTDWFTLTDENGETILVPPGKVWISLVPDSSGLEYSQDG